MHELRPHPEKKSAKECITVFPKVADAVLDSDRDFQRESPLESRLHRNSEQKLQKSDAFIVRARSYSRKNRSLKPNAPDQLNTETFYLCLPQSHQSNDLLGLLGLIQLSLIPLFLLLCSLPTIHIGSSSHQSRWFAWTGHRSELEIIRESFDSPLPINTSNFALSRDDQLTVG